MKEVHFEESTSYREARRALWEAEVALKEQREQVAAMRRALPQDTEVPDWPVTLATVAEPVPRADRLSGLFHDPDKPLVLVHFMYGPGQGDPCPMCSMWADGYNGVVAHLRERTNFALAVASPMEEFLPVARARGWDNLQLVSTAGTGLKRALGMEDEAGSQFPGVSVFVRRGERVVHTYTGGAMMGEGHFRGMDLFSPVWHFLDLTPDGRGDWMPGPG